MFYTNMHPGFIHRYDQRAFFSSPSSFFSYDFDFNTATVVSFCAGMPYFIHIGPPVAELWMTSYWFSRWQPQQRNTTLFCIWWH